jgi:hemerythrin
MSSQTTCLTTGEINNPCAPNRLPGVADVFYGLNELISKYMESTLSITHAANSDLNIDNKDYRYIINASRFDLYEGLTLVENRLVALAEEDLNSFLRLLFGLFLSMLIVIIIIMFLFLVPLPSALRDMEFLTNRIVSLSDVHEVETVRWRDEDFETHVERIDIVHKKMISQLQVVVGLLSENSGLEIVMGALDIFMIYMCVNFNDEENLMNKLRYPKLLMKKHYDAHASLIKKILEFMGLKELYIHAIYILLLLLLFLLLLLLFLLLLLLFLLLLLLFFLLLLLLLFLFIYDRPCVYW